MELSHSVYDWLICILWAESKSNSKKNKIWNETLDCKAIQGNKIETVVFDFMVFFKRIIDQIWNGDLIQIVGYLLWKLLAFIVYYYLLAINWVAMFFIKRNFNFNLVKKLSWSMFISDDSWMVSEVNIGYLFISNYRNNAIHFMFNRSSRRHYKIR